MSWRVWLLVITLVGNLLFRLSAAAQDDTNRKLSPAELFQQTSPAIVRVDRYDQGSFTGMGTGFFISDQGLLVTNHHVIRDGDLWRVVFGDDRSLDVAGIVAINEQADVAVLKVKGRWLPYLALGEERLPAPGEKVLAIGNPLGLTNTISDGLLSGYRDTPGRPRMLQISAPISQGSSGGPLFLDGDPRVVGVTTSVASEGQNLNFAVPAREVARLLKKSAGRLAAEDVPAARELLAVARTGSAEQLERFLQRGAKYDQIARETVLGDDEQRYFNWEVDSKLLVNGQNVLAVELHQRGGVSSDLGFDLQLAAESDELAILVPKGATWKYLDNGTDQGTPWRQADFDDSQWKSGPAKLGYEDDARTVVGFGEDENNKHITTYFRHAFHTDKAASVKRLALSLLRDDGVIVYLNGKLAVCDNMDIQLDIDVAGDQGQTPLHLATTAGNEAAVRLLLEAGAMPNRPTQAGKTALDLATENHRDDVATALRQKGGLSSDQLAKLTAALGAVREDKLENLTARIGQDVQIDWQDGDGATLLHHAVYAGHEELAKWLLDRGAHVNHGDVEGYRPLHVAVLHGRNRLVELLLDNGADAQTRNDDGDTCLIHAAQAGHHQIAPMLLDKGASIDARSASTGRTALFYALRDLEVLQLLIQRGADLNAEDRGGVTSLSLAVERGLSDAADILRQHGAKVSVPSALRTSLPKFQADLANSIGMMFRRIEPGKFTMGSPQQETGRSEHEQQHEVTLTKSYFIAVSEVTREQFQMFITESGHQPYSKGDQQTIRLPGGAQLSQEVDLSWESPGIEQAPGHPAVLVSWLDAVAFCRWLGRREGKAYRLPTEAEWEYACRAGTSSPYYNGHTLEDLKKSAWCNYRSGSLLGIALGTANKGTQAVGSFQPNAWGLYDMHGNVHEWTGERFGTFSAAAATDPVGPQEGDKRVHRGGSWSSKPASCRSAYRDGADPKSGYPDVGFRVVMEAT